MCDTLCVLGDGVTLFAKNSDRPPSEPQILEAFARRPGGGRLRTQYIEIPDAGAAATALSRPTWLWGAEHGMNEHRVVIGNEAIFTVDDASKAPPALIGMDLVRLGLERGRDAVGALECMTDLLDTHGQGGVCDDTGFCYWSSFLIADPTSAWILETSGRTWAARPVVSGAAISNGLTLRRDWTRASGDVPPGTDVDSWRHRSLPTGFADRRLAAGRAFVDGAGAPTGTGCDPRAVVGALRDHGSGPWGVPGARSADTTVTPAPPPDRFSADGDGWTVCLHARPSPVTTASLVALVPEDPRRPARAWVAPGSPCVSVYVPVPPPGAGAPVPAVVTDAGVWHRFAAVRDAVGADAGALAAVRAELSVVEDRLWDEADALDADADAEADADAWARFGLGATTAVSGALDRLVAAGIGLPAPARSGPGPKSDR